MAPTGSHSPRAGALARTPALLVCLLPGALTVYLGFNAGGFFIGSQAIVAIVLLVLIAVRATAARHPLEGWSPLLAAALAGLALFAAWTALSAMWSGAPFRALIAFELALLYLVTLVLFGSLRWEHGQVRWMVRGMALAAVVVCGSGLVTRLLPEVWPLVYPSLSTRLSYPVTYWNAFGLLAALGSIMCFGLTSDGRERALVRVLAAAALPVLGAALLLTLSRGGIAAAAIGLAVCAIVGHPRALVAGLLATGPATAIAVAATYHADLLVSDDPLSRAARDEGEHVALVVALCVLGAALVRTLLLPGDAVLAELPLGRRTRRVVLAAGAVAVAAALAVAAVAVDVPRQYHRFVDGGGGEAALQDPRARLSNASNGGRIRQWNVALDEFRDQPIHGRGAGTYQLTWELRRDGAGNVRDAHSLYVEVMGELGIVGLLLVLTALLTILGGLALRIRGPDRALYAAIFAAAIAWALAAGIEWHWEMPVVTLWLFALGGAAISARPDRARAPRSFGPVFRIAIVGACCAVIVAVPLRLGVSQNRFESGYAALAAGDCARAQDDAMASLDAVGDRPEPYELLAACELRARHAGKAVQMIGEAIRRDPDNWRLRYGLAVIRAGAQQDPRAAARAALRLNPREPLAQAALAAFSRNPSPRGWRAAARSMRLPLPPL